MTSVQLDRKYLYPKKSQGDGLVRAGLILLTITVISVSAFWGYRLLGNNILLGSLISLISALFMLKLTMGRNNLNSLRFIYVLLVFAWIMVSSEFKLSIFLSYLPCLLLLLISDIHKHDIVFRLLYYAALVFAVGTVLQILYPSMISNIVLPQFSQFSQYASLERAHQSLASFAGFTNQPAVNAGFLVYGLGYIIISLSLNKDKRSGKNFLLAALLLLCLVATAKRAHFGFSLCAIMLAYYYASKGKTKAKRVFLIISISILLLFILSSLVDVYDFGVLKKFTNTIQLIQSGEEVFEYRAVLQSHALLLFQENPLFGIGWKQYRLTISNSQGYQLDTHNIYLQLLCETGIVGFFLFVSFFIYSLGKSIKLSKMKMEPHQKTMSLFALFIQLFFLMYGITGNPLYDFNYYMPYFFACAYSYSLYRALTRENRNH